ncbi:PEP-CTERM system TPR-repeat protein PrsT [Colwellia sp. MB3u-70]|uniref:XrtA/PEP-CTERM system TPR-repeat protein PrsT n=1 Tax=unclassified Colwellia TaxID=196834 RepID=UPI0015F48D4E|nr:MULTISPECIES: XrtA/PEP-CTERM system TPR-repeat protein PrsT [unclassified Colwellia]MBA6294051.1 PEP-CTERM system TPR-repeat protein PrsT [Colwellia sp. MB3u-8]MBA6307592.1 PEP-CTERM system TPR-repeat protein PrsT [Colwellia sp. MB3u-70]
MKFNQLVTYLGLAVFISACSENTTSQEHVVKAKFALEKNELSTSEIELKNALKVDGENAEARFLLGQLYLSQGNSLVAVKELERAYSLSYDANKVVPLLARAYFLAESYEDISSLAEDGKYLVIDSKIKYLAFKSMGAILSKKLELAQEITLQIKTLSESNSYTLLANAYVNFAENNNEEALSLVSKALLADPKNIDAFLLKGHISFALNKFDIATENFKQYEKFQPQVGVTKLFIANSLLRDNKYDEAEKYADEILASIREQPLANYVKAVVMFEKKDFTLAKSHAETALNQNYNLPVLKLIAGTSAFNLNNYEVAYHHLKAIVKQVPANHYSRKMLAISQLQLGLIDDINETLIGFNATTSEEVRFLSSLSFQLAELGAVDEAKVLAKQANESAIESSAEQSVRSGILKLMTNDPSGVEDLELAFEANPDFEGAELAIAYAALQTGDYDKALKVTKQWQEKQPDIAGSYNMLASIYIAQQNNELATQALQTSLLKEANNLFALTELAKLNFTEGNKKEAEKFAQRAVEQYPDNAKALRSYYASKPDEQALAKIEQAYQKSSDNIALSLLYIDALINSDDLTQALVISNAMETNVKTSKKLWLQRISIYKKQQNELRFITTIKEWLKANPYHIEPILMVSDYYVKQRQVGKALQYLDKALSAHHKESLVIKMVKVQLLLDTNKLYEAKKLYQDQQFQSIKAEFKAGLEGRIAFLEKDFTKAVEKLTLFYQAYPSRKNAILLSLSYKGDNQAIQAQKVLQEYLTKNEQDDRVRMMLADSYLATESDKAILAYEKIIINEPSNVIVLNNLSWLYLDKGALEKAQLHSKKAIELAPENPNVIDTRGMVLLKVGGELAARKALSKAYKISNGQDMSITLNYAEVLIANNLNKEAIALLQQSTTNNNELSQRKSSLMIQAKKQ